jgi:type 1 glutamine amidotransferase
VAALSGLVTAGGNDALPQLLEAMNSTDPLLLKLAIQLSPKLASRESTAALQQVLSNTDGPTRLLALGALVEQGDSGALADLNKLAASNNPAVRAEALHEMRRLTWATTDATILAQIAASAKEPESTVEVLTPAPYTDSIVATRGKAIAGTLAAGDKFLTYLDCGLAATASENGVTLRQVNGGSWHFPGSEKAAGTTFGTVAYNGGPLEFEITGLDPRKRYAVGFSWWDYDNNGRIQSVHLAGGNPSKRVEVISAAKLPAYTGSKLGPAIGSLPIDPALAVNGKLRVAFQRRAGPNATVSELWIVETQAGNAAATKASISAGETVAAATQAPAAPVDLTAPAEGTKVLIVTGDDYPGHPWKQTAPALQVILEKDPRLKVRIVEDPTALASPKLKDWDVVIIHFMDWEKPGPGPEARENLRRFVAGGKGMMLTHFACGAWDNNEWPEFKNLAGRVWFGANGGRQHDPHGKFTVEIADPEHPITKGMSSFETLDELYTCLMGDAPIHVVAKATSKVDKKDYPMAFVLNYGQGRVFHTVLGHDARAYASPGVGELLRRGCDWAAGR